MISARLLEFAWIAAAVPLFPSQGFGHEGLADVVERVISGVVNIRTTDAPVARERSERSLKSDDFFSLFLGTGSSPEARKSAAPSRSLGSGFFYGDAETIVTNHHVIKDARAVVIYATEFNIYRKATVVGRDPDMDLALLKVAPVKGTRTLSFGSSEKLRLGSPVFAIGNPFGYGNTVSSGILSARGRSVGSGALSHLLQTDVPLNPGNSGGPLFDMNGRVVGINSANVTEAQGISFAIPAELAERRVKAMQRGGVPSQAWLGFYAEDILDAPSFSAHSYGVVVKGVVKGAPAVRAGLRKGDVIREIKRQKVKSMSQLETVVKKLPLHSLVELVVYRGGKTVKLRLRTVGRPAAHRTSQAHNLL